MDETSPSVSAVVFGAGSIGKRHIRNFLANGCTNLTVVEPRSERHSEVEELVADINAVPSSPMITFLSDPERLSDDTEFDIGIICTPPKWHLELIEWCGDRNIPIVCEKPLCKDVDDWSLVGQVVGRVEQGDLFNMVAYNYRFCRGLLRFKEILDSGRIGKVVSFRGSFSENVRDWHPWEGLNFYMSSIDQGGGALLDESHLLDICRWLFGEPTAVCALNGTHSSLRSEEIFETDDLVEVVAEFETSVVGSIHMDLYGKHHNKMI